jgi:flagellar biosynthesis/type III secretory pathway protein FliH
MPRTLATHLTGVTTDAPHPASYRPDLPLVANLSEQGRAREAEREEEIEKAREEGKREGLDEAQEERDEIRGELWEQFKKEAKRELAMDLAQTIDSLELPEAAA